MRSERKENNDLAGQGTLFRSHPQFLFTGSPIIFYFSVQKTPQIFNFQLVMGLQYFHNMNVFLIPIKF